MTRLIVDVGLYHYWIREGDPDDVWDTGEEGADITSVSARRLREWEEREKWIGHETFFTVGEGAVVYVPVALYYDGDTFGSSTFCKVLGVYATQEDADAAVKAAEEVPEDTYSLPWHGYFAGLKSIEVFPVVIG